MNFTYSTAFHAICGRLGRIGCCGLAVLVLGGCGKKPTDAAPPRTGTGEWRTHEWAMTRGGRGLHGRVEDRVPVHPVVEWTYAAGSPVVSEAAVAGGVIVFGDREGVVHAVDFATGKERWRAVTKDAVEAAPAVVGDKVFTGSNDGVFRALALATGKELWSIEGGEKFPTGGVAVTGPDDGGDWILVNGYDGVARCLQARDGKEVWRHETEDFINGSPVVLDGGLVAFGGCDAVIHVIRLKDGTTVNQLKTDAQIIRSLAGWGDTVYGVNHANQLVAAAVRGSRPLWLYESDGAQFLTAPSADGERIYVGSRDKRLHAVNRASGKPEWKFATGGRVESAPLVFDDALVFGSGDGRLYALDKRDGREIWRLDLGENLPNAPAFARGRIVIGGGDGTLFVIRGGAGK